LYDENAKPRSIVEKMGQPVGVTFDARNNHIYWTDAMDKNEAIYRSTLDGQNIEKIIDTGSLIWIMLIR